MPDTSRSSRFDTALPWIRRSGSKEDFRDELAGDDLTIEDAWTVLKSGNIYDAPEPDIRTGEWKYRMEGYTPDGQWLAIVFCFKTRERAFLITVFSVEARGRNK